MASQLKEVLLTFSETTSFHGVFHMNHKGHPSWLRLAWVLAFVVILGAYLYMLSGTLMNYYSYPVVTNVEYKTTHAIKFPSVTICNTNVARYSLILADRYALYVASRSGIPTRSLPQAKSVNTSRIDMVNITQQLAHQPENMYVKCAFNTRSCNAIREMVWATTPYGVCHTFNSAQTITKHGQKKNTRPGGLYGLNLLINVEEYEHAVMVSLASGIAVLVHEPHVVPDVQEMGFAVPAGTETQVAMKKTVVKRLPEPYAKPPNLCEDTFAPGYKNPLKYFSHYSHAACRRECQMNHQISLCGCTSHLYDGHNATLCPYDLIHSCSMPAREQYMADPSTETSCGCRPECEETIYDVTVSSASINDLIKQQLVRQLNVPKVNSSNVDKNIINLAVYFGEMRYTVVEQHSLYTPVSLFGELGGQLGLCLGASVLTTGELLHLMVTICRILCKSCKSNAVDRQKSNNPCLHKNTKQISTNHA